MTYWFNSLIIDMRLADIERAYGQKQLIAVRTPLVPGTPLSVSVGLPEQPEADGKPVTLLL